LMERYSLYVTTFGDFSISVADAQAESIETVSFSSRSKKLMPLIQYLIIHRDHSTSVSELCEIFWPGEPADSSANALKILVHRARNELDKLGVFSGRDLILNHQGSYQWNNDIPMEVDCELFDRLYLESIRKTGDSQLAPVLEAVSLYKGRFLPMSMASYSWVVPLYDHYHLRFVELCINGAATLEKLKQYDKLVDCLETLMDLGTNVESLHIQFIRALFRSGNKEKALQFYRQTSEFFYMQHGKAPSAQFMSLYEEISADIRDFEEDVNIVLHALPKPSAHPGALFCNLNVFRDISQLKIRENIVFGTVSQLALITVSGSSRTQPSKKVMDNLPQLISGNLRLSDVCCQYSMRQFLVLLPNTSREDGLKMILNLEQKLKTGLRGCNVVLQHSLTQLDKSVVIPSAE